MALKAHVLDVLVPKQSLAKVNSVGRSGALMIGRFYRRVDVPNTLSLDMGEPGGTDVWIPSEWLSKSLYTDDFCLGHPSSTMDSLEEALEYVALSLAGEGANQSPVGFLAVDFVRAYAQWALAVGIDRAEQAFLLEPKDATKFRLGCMQVLEGVLIARE